MEYPLSHVRIMEPVAKEMGKAVLFDGAVEFPELYRENSRTLDTTRLPLNPDEAGVDTQTITLISEH